MNSTIIDFLYKYKLIILIIILIILEINNFEIFIVISLIVLLFTFKNNIIDFFKNNNIEKFNDYCKSNIINKNNIINDSQNESYIFEQSLDNPAGNNLAGEKFIDNIINNDSDSDNNIDNNITDYLIDNQNMKNDGNNIENSFLTKIIYTVPKYHSEEYNTNLHQLLSTKKEQFLEPCNYKSELLKK